MNEYTNLPIYTELIYKFGAYHKVVFNYKMGLWEVKELNEHE